MIVLPDAANALAQLRELAEALSRPGNADLLVDFGHLVDHGSIDIKIDRILTKGADKRVALYQLSDGLKAMYEPC